MKPSRGLNERELEKRRRSKAGETEMVVVHVAARRQAGGRATGLRAEGEWESGRRYGRERCSG